MSRQYTKRRRAEKEARTRERIARAAMELHEELGPAQTSIKAIAERAGVQRLTVYRHFPEEKDLFAACSSMYDRLNPPPDPSEWRLQEDPEERVRVGLDAIYEYYERAEQMLSKVFRDLELKPVLQESVEEVDTYFAVLQEILLEPWGTNAEESPLLGAAISHAQHFPTWQSLVRVQGLSRDQAVDLMARFITATAGHAEGSATPGTYANDD